MIKERNRERKSWRKNSEAHYWNYKPREHRSKEGTETSNGIGRREKGGGGLGVE